MDHMTKASAPGTIQIRLGVVSIAALLIALAALTTLVVVVAVQDADLLSVVALALAVIAFSAQLIIYVVQTADSATSARRALELHTELSALLSELRERTGNTQRSVDSINSRLLEAVIGKTESTAEASSPQEFAERVAETYASASRATHSAPGVTESDSDFPRFPEPLPEQIARPIHEYMSAWPSADETDDVEAALRAMSPLQLESLQGLAGDLWRSTRSGASLGPGLPAGAKFPDPSITEKVRGWKLQTLSPRGRQIGRVFTAQTDAPPWAAQLLAIRNEVEQRADRARDWRDYDD